MKGQTSLATTAKSTISVVSSPQGEALNDDWPYSPENNPEHKSTYLQIKSVLHQESIQLGGPHKHITFWKG